jgi:hypothetical protein
MSSRPWRVALVVAPALAAVTLLVPAGSAATGTPVQDRYAAPGPDAVVHVELEASSGDVPFELYRPADLGPPGTLHPVVTWGNGSWAHPWEYDPFLRHLASWGFVVVASTFDQVGTGAELLGGVDEVRRRSEDPDDPLFGHVDLEHVAASGHSQGAGGSVRAATAPGSPITTVLAFDLPERVFAFPEDKVFDVGALRVPVLLLSGSDDQLISGTATNQRYFAAAPAGAGMALLIGADHNGIQKGQKPYPGYATAWLRYQLSGDPVAAGAFTGAHPELLTAPGWQDQALKGLSPPAPPPPAATAPAVVAPAAAPPPSTPTGPELPATGRSTPRLLAALAGVASLALRLSSGRVGWPGPGGPSAPARSRPAPTRPRTPRPGRPPACPRAARCGRRRPSTGA